MILRDYQVQAIAELRHGLRQHPGEPGLLVAPTGAGKSEIFGWMARSAVSKGKRVGAAVNRRILVKDLCKRVDRLGLDYGVIMGSEPANPSALVQIASLDTLWRREIPAWDVCYIDECHFSLAEKYAGVIARLVANGTSVIGMSATPIRGISEGLGSIYKWMVRCPDTPELIALEYLVRPRVFALPQPDLSKVELVAGEFNQKQLSEACDQTVLTGDILKHWEKNGRGRPTIGFGVDIKHCRHMAEVFCGAGIRAISVDHKYKGDLDLVWSKLANYETEVVFNVGIAGYGWNCPPVSHLIDIRPTKSVGLCIQHWGRIMRACEGKVDAIINDHAGNSLRHGLPNWSRDWSLETGLREPKGGGARGVATCDKPVRIPETGVPATFTGPTAQGLMLPCLCCFESGPRTCCPYCGIPIMVQARTITVEEGELVEVTDRDRKKPLSAYDMKMRARYQELVEIGAASRKANGEPYSDKWAAMAFRVEKGMYPKKEWKEPAAI